MKEYYIYTDSGSDTIQAKTVEEAIAEWDEAPKWVKTIPQWERWLKRLGGYGAIQENGCEIARVSSETTLDGCKSDADAEEYLRQDSFINPIQ